MKIWLDTTLLSQYAINESSNGYGYVNGYADCGGGDCDSFPSSIVPFAPTLTKENRHRLYICTLQLTKTLHIQECDGSLWLVCDPVGSGKIVVLDAEAHALLERFRTPKTLQEIIADTVECSSDLAKGVALFISLGLLQDLDQPVSISEQVQSRTLSAWLHVTNACNLSCHYCYVDKTSEHMANDTSRRAVDAIIRSAVRHHYQQIQLKYAGGEAMLRLPQLLAIHDYALEQARKYRLNLLAGILTNGVSLPQRFIDQLKERQIRVMISLDGIGKHHDQQRPLVNGQGSFTLVDRTITRLLASGLVPGINVTVTQSNLRELPALMEYILERDLPFTLNYYRDNECSTHLSDLQFTDTQMINGMRMAFAYIEHHLPKRPLLGSLIDKASMSTPHQYTCSMGLDYLVIDQRGGVAKCQADISNTVTTIAVDDPLQVIREDKNGIRAVAVDDKEGCRSCEWRYWCSGGCPLLTYRLTGRSDIKSPNCAIYKALFPEAVRLEALRLLEYEEPITL
ncbi:MAG TPA: radical SAM protein [Ktedonobacteraceae bacterium]|nr:radical SAM protein [Ktedonobacteraceae bacterium]